ncbi:MAG: hypothetical protein ACFE89_12395 [Candidatus Hodarchaeota archaeon]
MPPPTDYAPPTGDVWLSWGQAFIFLVLFLIMLIMLVNYFFPRAPGEKPSLLAVIIVIAGIIFVLAIIGIMWILPA